MSLIIQKIFLIILIIKYNNFLLLWDNFSTDKYKN